MERLPLGIRAPRYYGVTQSEDGVWLWIENIRDVSPKKWTLDIFQSAARQLGRFHAAYLGGHPIPDQPWFSAHWFRSLWADSEWLSESMRPEAEGSFWKSPILQEMFAPRQKARIFQLIAEKKVFFDTSERLPQVLCHNDAQRRNILWTDRAYENDLTAIDWAFSGPGALGSDLCQLTGTSMWLYEYSPFDAGKRWKGLYWKAI